MMFIPTIEHPKSNELHTLLPSPIYARSIPLSLPRTSWMVNRSDITWQGCSKSDKPLITGTSEFFASSFRVSCFLTLAKMQSEYLLKTLALSPIVSPLPSCVMLSFMSIAFPPSCIIAVSKEIRVLVDGPSNNINKILPLSSSL